MTSRPDFGPSASVEMLARRSRALATIRDFFAARGVLEVDTPALVRQTVTDVHLHAARVTLPGERAPLHLHTSPEYAMKRLLAAGSGDIYQLAHVFRGDEQGPLHNAEFMMLEWYRVGWTLEALMREVSELIAVVWPEGGARVETLSYRDAFLREIALDPLEASLDELRRAAGDAGLVPPARLSSTRDELLDFLMAVRVGPTLGADTLTFVHRYPASQAALARLAPDDARVALRFELYARGVELANGFDELADAAEQRARFVADLLERERRGLTVVELDERLLAAIAAGLPPCAGVAVGFDRLLMLAAGVSRIADVMPFALDRA